MPVQQNIPWQKRILTMLASLIAIVGSVSWVMYVTRAGDLFSPLVIVGFTSIALIWIAITLQLQWRLMSTVVIFSLTIIGLSFPTAMGLRAGPLMIGSLAVMMAAAFHGRRTALMLLALQFAALCAIGYAAAKGRFSPAGFEAVGLDPFIDWIRGSVVYAFVTILQGAFVSLLMRSLTATNETVDRHELKLAEGDQLLKLFGDISSDYVYTVDLENPTLRPQLVSGAFERTTGYTPDDVEAVGGWLNVVHPADRPKLSAGFPLLQSGENVVTEYRIVARDGTIKWLKDYIYPIKNSAGVVNRLIGGVHDITESRRLEELMDSVAFYDPVTGLANRSLLMKRINQQTQDNAAGYAAALFIDLDNFKKTNDLFGHEIADQILLVVVERLRHLKSHGTTIARLAADEFIFLVPAQGQKLDQLKSEIAELARRILQSIRLPIPVPGQKAYEGTASIGVTYLGAGLNPNSAGEVLRQADAAMCRAKELGKNQTVEYTADLATRIIGRLALESDLEIALEEKQFELYYQLQLDHGRKALGAEVLLRWRHPDRGIVMPAEFIPLAEETGLIEQLGYWVFDEACRQLVRWNEKPLLKKLKLAVNVSARQFKQADFASRIQSIIHETGADATKLELELTESLMLMDISDTAQKMQQLRAMGLSLSIDDFGTGHSSLAYLKRLPITQLKIDQSFVRDIVHDKNDAIIVSTIIGMARNLHLEIIAEGVETEEQLSFLIENGCAAFQGFLFARPVALEDFEKLVA